MLKCVLQIIHTFLVNSDLKIYELYYSENRENCFTRQDVGITIKLIFGVKVGISFDISLSFIMSYFMKIKMIKELPEITAICTYITGNNYSYSKLNYMYC
jgi:hypothetical protein